MRHSLMHQPATRRLVAGLVARPCSAVLPSVRAQAQVPHRRQLQCRVQAVTDPASSEFGTFVTAAAPEDDGMSVQDIKAALLDSLYGTERGLAARSEVRAEINELITQLESKNPNPSPTEGAALLDGDWKLVYTSNSELLAVLALSRLPFVTIGDITQRVETLSNTVENKVQISVPLSRTSLATTASFEVRSPKRLQVKFEKGTIKTPQLLADIEIPSSISVMGQVLDLGQIKSLLTPLSDTLNGVISQVGSLIGQAPDLSFPLPSNVEQTQTWLLTTYLDEDTRITRGDGGGVYILVKQVSLPEVY